jgi:hypothetical protein
MALYRGTALLPAPFSCTYAWNRPTSTGGWRERPALALLAWEALVRDPVQGYAASKWSQLERQLILGQRLSPIRWAPLPRGGAAPQNSATSFFAERRLPISPHGGVRDEPLPTRVAAPEVADVTVRL